MPRLQSVESLQDRCIDVISTNLSKMKWPKCLADEMDHASNNLVLWRHCDLLPSKSLEPILEASLEKKQPIEDLLQLLTRKLEVLILPSSKIYFENTKRVERPTTIQLLSSAVLRNLPLKTVVLQYAEIPQELFWDFMPTATFQNLLSLDVSHGDPESINDSVLSLIGTYCQKLRVLNLFFCRGATDIGIQRLCVSSKDSGEASDIAGQCKSIVSLNIKWTGVTDQGAQLALRYLPQLRSLKYGKSLQAIAQLSHQIAGHVPLLGLEDLYSVYEKEAKGDLSTAVRLSPNLVRVKIEGSFSSNLDDEDIKALLHLDRLENLSLCGARLAISFSGGILPILKKFGRTSLERLSLQLVKDNVDLFSIAQFCPKLLKLKLVGNDMVFSPYQTLELVLPFPSLEYLYIYSSVDPSAASLLFLMSSASLIKIVLLDAKEMSDQLLKKSISLHGFPLLEEFVIGECNDGVTRETVDLLLALDNPLRVIYLDDEFEPFRHYPEWNDRVKKCNLDLYIDYFIPN